MNPVDKIQEIKNKIFQKKREYNILDSWHYMMMHYGWIPFEEFKKLDALIVGELISRINKMNEESNRRMKK